MVKLQTDFCGLKECWSVVFQPKRQYFFNQFTVIEKNILLILDNITSTNKKRLKKLALNNKSRKHQQGNLAVACQEI